MNTRRQWLVIGLAVALGTLIGSQFENNRSTFGNECREASEAAEMKVQAVRICTEHMVGCDLTLQDIETAITVQRKALACR